MSDDNRGKPDQLPPDANTVVDQKKKSPHEYSVQRPPGAQTVIGQNPPRKTPTNPGINVTPMPPTVVVSIPEPTVQPTPPSSVPKGTPVPQNSPPLAAIPPAGRAK